MDIVSHILYTPTVCSRSGLAGGRKGYGDRLITDKTVWFAMLFGTIPDIALGLLLAVHFITGNQENIFHAFDGNWVTAYHYTHSLLSAFLIAAVLYLTYRPLCIPSLGWVVHILMDAGTHDLGKFRTTVFYPLSDWAPNGLPYWHNTWIIFLSWIILPVIWLSLWLWRRRIKREDSGMDISDRQQNKFAS